jgi:hypothetical protein
MIYASGFRKQSTGNFVLPETSLFAVIGLLDLISTVYLISSRRAVEANPVMATVIAAYGMVGFAIFKAVMLGGPLAGAEMARKRHPRFVKFALRAGIVAYLLIYVVGSLHYNLRVWFH